MLDFAEIAVPVQLFEEILRGVISRPECTYLRERGHEDQVLKCRASCARRQRQPHDGPAGAPSEFGTAQRKSTAQHSTNERTPTAGHVFGFTFRTLFQCAWAHTSRLQWHASVQSAPAGRTPTPGSCDVLPDTAQRGQRSSTSGSVPGLAVFVWVLLTRKNVCFPCANQSIST